MLTGWTFFRIPSRVPLSTLAPAQDPFERKEERPRRIDLPQQARLILSDKSAEQVGRKVFLVLGEECAPHPVDNSLRSRQHMRIDDQACPWIVESDPEQDPRIRVGCQHGSGAPP